MKKIVLSLAVLMTLGLAACSSNAKTEDSAAADTVAEQNDSTIVDSQVDSLTIVESTVDTAK